MSAISLDITAGIGRLTLDRPDAFNTLNMQMARDLVEAALVLRADPSLRVVVMSGAGRAFCGGGDLREFSSANDPGGHVKEVSSYLHMAVSILVRLDAPVVAQVHGSAAGAGLGLVLGCDLVVAAESAKFVMAYTRAGLSPDGSSSYHLPRLVGLKRALMLSLLNPTLSATEAHDLGIVTMVVPDGELAERTNALAAELAAGPTAAFGATKRLLHSGCSESLETQMELESRSIAALINAHDGREGMAAFLEKRPPQFRGA